MPVDASGAHLTSIATGASTSTGANTGAVYARRGAGIVIPGPTQAGVAGTGTAAITFTAIAASWTTSDITVDVFAELDLDLTATTTTTNWKYVVNRKGADGAYYPIVSSAIHTDSGKTVSVSIGSGVAQGAGGLGIADATTGNTNWTAPFPFGDIIQIVFTPTGAFTGTLSLKGK